MLICHLYILFSERALQVFLKNELIYFNWRIMTLQYCGGFCHTSSWTSHGCTCVPLILNPPPTSLPTPSLWVVPEHQLWVPRFMHQTFTGHQFYTNTFQSCSLKSSHPHLLPPSLKDCSLYLCFFCCLVYRIVVTIFLNSLYLHDYTVLVFLFLTYLTLYNKLQFHPPH